MRGFYAPEQYGTWNVGLIMKYKVTYLKQKKKGSARQEAVFYDERDALNWEHHVRSLHNCSDIEIVPVWN
jgi:hypothetical protein